MQLSQRPKLFSILLALTLFLVPAAQIFGESSSVQIANNRPSGLKKNYSPGSSSYFYHTVKKGENLSTIAKKYGVSVQVVKAQNPLKNPNKLYVGSKLKIPGNKTASSSSSSKTVYHRVKKGENLSTIAKTYGVSIASIKANNKLANPNKLYVGTRLKIVRGSSALAVKSSHRSTAQQAGLNFIWPLKSVVTVERDGQNGVKSIGLVIRSRSNSLVYSAEDGVIKKIGYMRGYGNYIVVLHNSRYMTVYANLNKVSVQTGQKISKGSVMGILESGDARLHFQINRAGKPQDALAILPGR